MEDDLELRPSHVWVARTLYLNGQDSSKTNTIIEFDDPLSDESMGKAFVEVLLECGHELDLYTDFSPIRMDSGRYIIQSHKGFSVVEIDPAWTEEQIRLMEEAAAPRLDMQTWGSIFTVEEAQ